MQGHSEPLSKACGRGGGHGVQVLTAVEEFAVVRDKLQELGQQIDHDHSGLVYTPLTHVEVLLPFPKDTVSGSKYIRAVCTGNHA